MSAQTMDATQAERILAREREVAEAELVAVWQRRIDAAERTRANEELRRAHEGARLDAITEVLDAITKAVSSLDPTARDLLRYHAGQVDILELCAPGLGRRPRGAGKR